MLITIQIIAILQGIFLGLTLFKRRAEFKKAVFWLFMGCVASIVLFAIGDDDYNLLLPDSNWFFFHETLIITFFVLFVRYTNSGKNNFDKIDLIFFLPYLVKIIVESFLHFNNNPITEAFSELIEFGFVGMLLYCIYDILKHATEKWLLVFIIPFTLIYTIDEIAFLFNRSNISFKYLDSYGIFLVTISLFYVVIYKLIVTPKKVLPNSVENKYKSSSLSKTEVEVIKTELNRLMVEEKLFRNQKLNANEIAEKLGITRQQLSEVLNVYMNTRLQDFLNQHRVDEFTKCLIQDAYKNYTLLGIATEVGFSSKSSFNSTFKKLKGMTPSEYKKSLL